MTGRRSITIRVGTLAVGGVAPEEGQRFREALTRALAEAAPALARDTARPRPRDRAEAAAEAVVAAARPRLPR